MDSKLFEMSRTLRIGKTRDGRSFDAPRGLRRSYYSTEEKWARKKTNRKFRNRTNEALRSGRLDEVPARPVSTGGWITH